MPPQTAVIAAPATDSLIPTGTPLGPELLAGEPEELAFAVWQVLRSLRLWTAQPEDARDGLFDAAYMEGWERALLTGSLEPDLRFPLALIVGEMAAAPTAESRLSWACVCVCDWALGRGAVPAALAFAEAAALASPGQARYAWLAGRLMRTHGQGRAAERWLRRAYRLAVAQKDGETQARALTALGNLALQRGNFPAARAFQLRALRISRRWRLREQEGMALHDLFSISINDGNRADGERYARAAVAAYRNSPRLPRLVHDIAFNWLEQGYAGRAMGVLEAVRPHFRTPDLQVRVAANLARSAGTLGDRERYDRYRTEVAELRPALETAEAIAPALLQLAYGAVSLGDWSTAAQLTAEAMDAARKHEEMNILIVGDQLLAAISRQDVSGMEEIPRHRRAATPAVDELAAEMVMLLSEAGASV